MGVTPLASEELQSLSLQETPAVLRRGPSVSRFVGGLVRSETVPVDRVTWQTRHAAVVRAVSQRKPEIAAF